MDDKTTLKPDTKLVMREAASKTLRDEFAIAALPSILEIMNEYGKNYGVIVEPKKVAETAYDYADAMMEYRR